MNSRLSATIIATTGTAIFVFVGVTMWWLLQPTARPDPFPSLALLLLVGLAAFIGLMNFLSFSAQFLGMSDVRQPFGLPEGSVRAILTIAFIVIVGVLASYLLTQSSARQSFARDPITVATNLTIDQAQNQAQALQQRLSAEGLVAYKPTPPAKGGTPPASGSAVTYDLDVYQRQDHRLSDDVSKQILTMLSTILAAMIGFYFGARADGSPVADEAAERLRIVAELNALIAQPPTLETVRASASVKLRLDPAKKEKIDQIVKSLDEVQRKVDDAQNAAGDQSAPIDKVRTARDEARAAVARLKDIDERIEKSLIEGFTGTRLGPRTIRSTVMCDNADGVFRTL